MLTERFQWQDLIFLALFSHLASAMTVKATRCQSSILPTLSEAREDDSPLLLVLIAELLAVTLLLLPSPAPHLRTSHESEEQHTPAQLADQEDTQPSQNLEEVVGAGNQTETKSRWNATLGSTSATQTTQDIMCVQVRQLTKDKDRETKVHKTLVGSARRGSSIRAEDPVSDVETGQNPVVGTVLDDVAGGHGCATEAVHEDGFELALQEVQGQQGAD